MKRANLIIVASCGMLLQPGGALALSPFAQAADPPARHAAPLASGEGLASRSDSPVMTDQVLIYRGDLSWKGVPFSGKADLEFRLYGTPTGIEQIGSAVVAEQWDVVNGEVIVGLDFAVADPSLVADGAWMEVSVNGTVLSPRRFIPSAGWSLGAGEVGAAGTRQAMKVDRDALDEMERDLGEGEGDNREDGAGSGGSTGGGGSGAGRPAQPNNPGLPGGGFGGGTGGGVGGGGSGGEGEMSEPDAPGWNFASGRIWTLDRVGVGLSTPNANSQLHVRNSGAKRYALLVQQTGTSDYAIYAPTGLVYFGRNVGIGETTPAEKLSVKGVIQSTTGGFRFPDGTLQSTAAQSGFWRASGGGNPDDIYYGTSSSFRVGIGVQFPTHPLTVNGQIKLLSGGIVFPDNTTISTAYTAGQALQLVNGSQFRLAQQDATDGKVLKWSAAQSGWIPQDDLTGGGGSFWVANGADIVNANAGDVWITTGELQRTVIGRETPENSRLTVWTETHPFAISAETQLSGGTAVVGVNFQSGANSFGVSGYSSQGRGVDGNHTASSGVGYGVRGRTQSLSSGFGVYSTGNFAASGTKDFRIDHPLDPANMYLRHSAVESPDVINLYRGTVTLDGEGCAVVALPRYFEAVNRDFHYQLTAIGAPAPELHVSDEVRGNTFRIAGGPSNGRVSWTVTGLRNDPFVRAYPRPVEEMKIGAEKGKYQHPELYGMPVEASIDYRPDAPDSVRN
ncbi:MAG: hypothetical protein HRU76_02880 [Phycisphaeraceae bacterium]|nr:MAG: hypothetical protein HRU76_02880 [Phycisphaeraceae bacterium]